MTSPETSREHPPMYKVREATVADAEAIARIQHDTWIKTYANEEAQITQEDVRIYLGDFQKRKEKWEKDLKDAPETWKTFVADENGKILGFCRIHKKEDEGYVNALYLDLEQEGKGIASKLMKRVFEFFDQDKPVKLEVAAYNDHAISVYKHYGFVEVGEENFPRPINGKTMPLKIMRRPAQEK